MKHNPAHAIAYATVVAALLSACGTSPENPSVTPLVVASNDKAFFDEYLKGITGGAPEQSPAPTSWEDLMVPPIAVRHGQVEVSGQVSAPDVVNHG